MFQAEPGERAAVSKAEVAGMEQERKRSSLATERIEEGLLV